MTDSAADAVAMADSGVLALPIRITVLHKAGERYPKIVAVELGPKPDLETARDVLSRGDACPDCRGYERITRPGKGPHAGQQVCAHCGRWLRWSSEKQTESMAVSQEV